MPRRLSLPRADPLDFAPALIRLQEKPPHPLGQRVLWVILGFILMLFVWASVGRLDIVAVAEGKLVPQTYVKIVQPAEAGIVKEILVKEGELVQAGQVLMRMDALVIEADAKSLEQDLRRKILTLRRIDAEVSATSFRIQPADPQILAREVDAQFRANRAALEAALAEEHSRLVKARQERAAAEQVKRKLLDVLPHYREQDRAFEDLASEGYASSLAAGEKKRERIEKEQELKTQEYLIESAHAGIVQSERKLAQINSDYRRQLFAERNEIQAQADKLGQEIAKQAYKQQLLELKAPQTGTVKDLATHTAGAVVQPGTVLLTLVPREENLRAEVWISNSDIGFVRSGQPVKLKVAAFPFQKYGMVDGRIEHVSADAADNTATNAGSEAAKTQQALVYKALVVLQTSQLEVEGERFPLSSGMLTTAEIRLGHRTVMEYLLSPVQKAWHEAARER